MGNSLNSRLAAAGHLARTDGQTDERRQYREDRRREQFKSWNNTDL